MHAMVSMELLRKNGMDKDLATTAAKLNMDDYVRSQGVKFLENALDGDFDKAYFELGMGMHPLMDMFSPSHKGWQVWDGSFSLGNLFDWTSHFFNEAFTPEGASAAVSMIQFYYMNWLEMYNNVKPK
jgi:hypothetical protein